MTHPRRAVVLVASALLFAACGSTSPAPRPTSSPVSRAAPTPRVITAEPCPDSPCAQYNGLELSVSHIDVNAAASPGTIPLKAGGHYVSMTLTFINRSPGGVTIDGSPLPTSSSDWTGIFLQAETGPVSGSEGVDVRTAIYQVPFFGQCGTTRRPAPSPGVMTGPGMVIPEPPPTRQLAPGAAMSASVCWEVDGPVAQKLWLIWAPAHLTTGPGWPLNQLLVPLTPATGG